MKFFIIIKEESERLPNKNFLNLNGIPLYKHLLNELESVDVYVDTDSDRIIDECKTLTNVICYKRDLRFIEMENNIDFETNYMIYQLLGERSYLKTAYDQVKEREDVLDTKLREKFYNYPTPKAIIEEWQMIQS